ncbi:response regulator [Dietzia timorensis]|uniref:Transcriptional regulatory protein DegU n=1 Tax=Dietzia timorensis TaxID=499555 RepID=A0A173LKW3_9ACTN|nr:response regulator transcription factor [Dietzia timorensis]ANI92925.1 Transcriptional regulatory protein DegU [Dietzia timorensis]
MSAVGEERLRLLVVDDQELLRRGLRMLLESTGDAEVVGEARDGHEALGLLETLDVDAIITDAVMPGMGGAELIAACSERFPGVPVVVVTTFDTTDVVASVLDAGAAGLLLKDTSPEKIVDAVRSALAGGVTVDPRVAKTALRTRNRPADPLSALTKSEREVAMCIADGLTNADIAERLHLAPGTVKNYVSTVMRKLETPDRTALALKLDRMRTKRFQL